MKTALETLIGFRRRMAALAGAALASAALSPVLAAAPPTDAQIESAAKESYVFRTFLKGDDVRVNSLDGAVTLTGTVDQETHQTLARDTAAALPGVKGVENALLVKESSSATPPDAWLADKVRMTLALRRSASPARAEVAVKDGNLTLRGEADDQPQKDRVAALAREVAGIKDIKNKMTLAASPKTPPRAAPVPIDDASITAQVKLALLLNRSTTGVFAKVDTEKAVVSVHGVARDDAEKSAISGLVADVNGVDRVENRMTVGDEAKGRD